MEQEEGTCRCDDATLSKQQSCSECDATWTRLLKPHERVAACPLHRDRIAICWPARPRCAACRGAQANE